MIGIGKYIRDANFHCELAVLEENVIKAKILTRTRLYCEEFIRESSYTGHLGLYSGHYTMYNTFKHTKR